MRRRLPRLLNTSLVLPKTIAGITRTKWNYSNHKLFKHRAGVYSSADYCRKPRNETTIVEEFGFRPTKPNVCCETLYSTFKSCNFLSVQEGQFQSRIGLCTYLQRNKSALTGVVTYLYRSDDLSIYICENNISVTCHHSMRCPQIKASQKHLQDHISA